LANDEVTEKCRATVVMLGASNLTRGISTAVGWTQRIVGSPLDFYVALGHGRSYGLRSRVLVRELPAIRDCALWQDLERRDPAAPVYALITDIGNDILYQAPIAAIVEWLRFALDRFKAMGARITIVQLPVHNVLHTTDFQFWLLDKLIFPGRRLDKSAIKQNALLLADEVKKLAEEYGASVVEHDPAWYGLDPIHLKMRSWRSAWGRIIGGWAPLRPEDGEAEATSLAFVAPPSFAQWFYLRALAPAVRWIMGRERRRLQPAGRLRDGSRFHLY
jgi:hypothetical protein